MFINEDWKTEETSLSKKKSLFKMHNIVSHSFLWKNTRSLNIKNKNNTSVWSVLWIDRLSPTQIKIPYLPNVMVLFHRFLLICSSSTKLTKINPYCYTVKNLFVLLLYNIIISQKLSIKIGPRIHQWLI